MEEPLTIQLNVTFVSLLGTFLEASSLVVSNMVILRKPPPGLLVLAPGPIVNISNKYHL